MHILKEGRSAYLEFLRNLAPQTLFLSFALVAGRDLQPSCCYPENFKQTAISFCFLIIWLAAVWANSSLFIEKYLISAGRINRASRLFIKTGVTGIKNLCALLCFAWRNERRIFWETVVVFVVVEFGLLIVIMAAIGSATTFIKLLNS